MKNILKKIDFRDKWPYFIAIVIYAAWRGHSISSQLEPKYMESIIGKLTAAFFTMFGYSSYHLSGASFSKFSMSVELIMFFGPGFFAGLIVGLFRVRRFRESFKGLIPPAICLAPFILLMFIVGDIGFIDLVISDFITTAGPYSVIGAIIGWLLVILFRNINSRRGLTPILVLFTLATSANAWGPAVGHRYIVARGNVILDRDFPDEYKEIDNSLTLLQDGAEEEDGTTGLRGAMHFYNPFTTRVGKGLFSHGIPTPREDAISVATQEWLDAVAAYKIGQKGTAFNLLGRVAHLVTGDLFQPQHVHDDPHSYDWIGSDGEVIESRFDSNTSVVTAYGLSLLAPISGPLTSEGVSQFGNVAARMVYLESRFSGTLQVPTGTPTGTETGLITLPNNTSLPVHLVLGDPESPNHDLRYNHFETDEANPQFYDYNEASGGRGDIALFWDGFNRHQDWWELPVDEDGGQQYFYFYQFQNITFANGDLADYYIQQFVPYSLSYTAGLLKAGAKAFDSVPPTVELRRNDAQGEIIPNNGFGGDKIYTAIGDVVDLLTNFDGMICQGKEE